MAKIYQVLATNHSCFPESYEETIIGYYTDKTVAIKTAKKLYYSQAEDGEYELRVEEIELDNTNANSDSLLDGTLPDWDEEVIRTELVLNDDEDD